MQKKLVVGMGMALALSVGQVMAQNSSTADMTRESPTCDDLNWSAGVLSDYPDIAETCSGVYEKNGELYAKASVEVVRVRGNRITFRPIHTDGSKGDSKSIQVDSGWRAEIGGRKYRASDLMRGQQLNVYIPEDRFALAVQDESGVEEVEVIEIEEVEEVEMPTTASPLFLFGLAGGAMLTLGGLLTSLRRRLG